MKKKVVVLFFVMFILFSVSFVSARMCDSQQVLDVLRKALYIYYTNPDESSFEAGDLRDLLTFYVGIQAGQITVDCTAQSNNIDRANALPDTIPSCSDGTKYGKCSNNKPIYCYAGRLVPRCRLCGCPTGQWCDITYVYTEKSNKGQWGKCYPGTNITCTVNSDCGISGYVGNYSCVTGDVYRNYTKYTCLNLGETNSSCKNETILVLIDDCNATEQCVEGQPECQMITPQNLTCSDGTQYDTCSITKPKYCSNGTLTDNCQVCGCSTGTCQTNGTCLTFGCGKEVLITTGEGWQSAYPDIYGDKIVWTQQILPSDPYYLPYSWYGYISDLSTNQPTLITSQFGDRATMPAIYNNKLVYVVDGNIYMTTLCQTEEPQRQPVTFAEHVISTDAYGVWSVYAINLDNDNDVDVISAESKNNMFVWYENDGSGNFPTYQIFDEYAYDAKDVYGIDIDGDGDVDIVGMGRESQEKCPVNVYCYKGWIAWYENDGHGNFIMHDLQTDVWGAWSIHPADVDNDNDIDIISTSGGDFRFESEYNAADAEVAWWENDGSESFTKHTISSWGFDKVYTPLYVIDVDGDNDVDIVSGGNTAWYENDGHGNFAEHIVLDSIGDTSVFAVDLDIDGDVDILSTSTQDIIWHENDGGKSFTKHIISTNVNYAVGEIFAIDLDNDGDNDIISTLYGDESHSGEGGRVAWWENDGSESFTEHIISTNVKGAWSIYATDIDGDKDVDIIIGATEDNKIIWFENLMQ